MDQLDSCSWTRLVLPNTSTKKVSKSSEQIAALGPKLFSEHEYDADIGRNTGALLNKRRRDDEAESEEVGGIKRWKMRTTKPN